MINIKTALISVYDKTGILELSQRLIKHGVLILSSGGTAAYLKAVSYTHLRAHET